MNNPTFSLTYLENEADRLTAKLAKIQEQRDALRTVIDLLHGSIEDAEMEAGTSLDDTPIPVPAPDPAPIPAQVPGPTEPHDKTDLSGLSVDFTGTHNMLDRIRRIGQAGKGRLLNLTKVSKFLLHAGESTASLQNLRNNVYSCMKDHPEYFEKVDSGTYLYHDTPRSLSYDDGYDLGPELQLLPPSDLR